MKAYRLFSIRHVMYLAHRVSYSLYYKCDPLEKEVCHQCDNPLCVNPHHLFLATQQENMKNRDQKGRTRVGSGERHRSAKLTIAIANTVRERHMAGESIVSLSREYCVHTKTVWCIVHGLTWKPV